jgi:hypothetical protein
LISVQIVIALLFIHFVADFLLQSDWMAINKSKQIGALLVHALVYSISFLAFGMSFWFITFLTHAVTDAITSRITSKLWFVQTYPRPHVDNYGAYPLFALIESNKRHWFFVVIGLDQFIHFVTLLLTFIWLQ